VKSKKSSVASIKKMRVLREIYLLILAGFVADTSADASHQTTRSLIAHNQHPSSLTTIIKKPGSSLAQQQQNRPLSPINRNYSWSIHDIPRGGGALAEDVGTMVTESVDGLSKYLKGSKADTLLLLLTTALNTPLCHKLNISPILGFLATGLAAGPKGFGLVADIHTTEMIADLGVVLFLFEMGIHLSLDTLMKLKKEVFGLGGCQFAITAAVVAAIAGYCGQTAAAMVVLGGSLALSSSAFVLQLLKDKGEMNSKFGKSSFSVLLLQDLMVVPLLVVTPLLAPGSSGSNVSVGKAIGKALVQAALALSTIGVIGKFLLNPFFDTVAGANDQNSFVGAVLATILGMSFLTEGLGLSNTLGAFLAGMLLSENKHVHKIEKEVSPFRGILVGLFFFTVGFEIDLKLIGSQTGLVLSIVAGIVALKAAIATVLCMAFGLTKATSQRVGLILSQGGEFAFVAFRMARGLGILTEDMTKLMLTCVSLTMAITPFLESLGSKMEKKMDQEERAKMIASRTTKAKRV